MSLRAAWAEETQKLRTFIMYQHIIYLKNRTISLECSFHLNIFAFAH